MSEQSDPVLVAEAAARVEYETAVSEELARLDVSGMLQRPKRRATILALAEAAVTPGMSKADAFRRLGVVNKATFHNPKKDWGNGTSELALLFQNVLSNVVQLTVDFHNGRRLREQQARIREHEEMVLKISDKVLGKLLEVADLPVTEVVKEKVLDDGKTIYLEVHQPSPHWRPSSIGTVLTAVDRVKRMALGTHTDNQKLDINGLSSMTDEELSDLISKL